MKSIQLKRKKVVPIEINGKQCVAVFDNLTISYFQKTYKKGILEVFNQFQSKKVSDIDIDTMLTLLSAIIRDKKTNRILGYDYFKQFDMFDVMDQLADVVTLVMGDNLPKATEGSEKN